MLALRVIVFSLLAAALPAQASHCEEYSTSAPEVDTTPLGGAYYVEANGCWDLCDYWIYEEANGIEGLQRGDEIVDDTCHGMIPSDKIIF